MSAVARAAEAAAVLPETAASAEEAAVVQQSAEEVVERQAAARVVDPLPAVAPATAAASRIPGALPQRRPHAIRRAPTSSAPASTSARVASKSRR